jgi:tetratricopeptide (TPR) repeat protein
MGRIRLTWMGLLLTGLWGLGGCQTEPITSLQGSTWAEDTLTALAYPAFLVNTSTAERYRQQGLAYRAEGDLERSVATLKIAAALDPYNPNSHIILGWTQHLSGDRPNAIGTLNTALGQDPNQVEALNALGIVYLVEGQLDQATATHHRALELKPDNEIAHYNLSLAYERLGEWEPAIHHAQKATELEPQNPHPWVALALAQASSGNSAAAQITYRRAVQMDGRYRQRSYLDHLAQAGFSAPQIDAVANLQAMTSP